jgi:iron only hydrogenase large subunit-like protein
MGFNRIYDGSFFRDFSLNEKAGELLDRLKNNAGLPMLSACSPALINFVKEFYPDLMENLSINGSPQRLFGAWAKTRYSELSGVDKSLITTVSFMPCIACKYETKLPINISGSRDLDFVLTSRELAIMINSTGIDDLSALPESSFDILTGDSQETSFAASAALAESHEGIKEVELVIRGTRVKGLFADGLANARKIMDSIRKRECDAAFVEITSCDRACTLRNGVLQQ